jgi:hypothetical protein
LGTPFFIIFGQKCPILCKKNTLRTLLYFEVIRLPIFLDIFKEHPIPSFGLSSGIRRKSFFHETIFLDLHTMIAKSKIIDFFKNSFFRLLRIIGILCVIYVSMVFYLALTERRNAFPRAIYHKEANEAIRGKAEPLTCTLEDGVVLHGFSLGNQNDPLLLYYPEADEDAAQFLAQVDSIPNVSIVTFNYRGSGENKGTPSAETFEKDAEQIKECAIQVNGNIPKYITGRGTGAILAAQQSTKENITIFIDPLFDIASAIHQKYGFLYPKFLIRTNVKASLDKLSEQSLRAIVLIDRKQHENRTMEEIKQFPNIRKVKRGGESLQKSLTNLLKDNLYP